MHRSVFYSLVTSVVFAACAPVEGDEPGAPEASAEAYTGRAGDLRPTGLTASCAGGAITARGAIAHGGALAVGASTAQVRFGLPPVASVDVAVPALSNGASAPVAASRGGFAPGSYTVWLVADARGQVTEGSESNNSVSVSVTCHPSMSDLRVENVRALCNHSVGYFHYDLVNRGSVAAGPSVVRAQLSNPYLVENLHVGGVPAGGRLTLVVSRGFRGASQVALAADATNVVQEIDEQNNAAGLSFPGCP